MSNIYICVFTVISDKSPLKLKSLVSKQPLKNQITFRCFDMALKCISYDTIKTIFIIFEKNSKKILFHQNFNLELIFLYFVVAITFKQSKQGRPPRESEKGAVRCSRRARVGH